MSGFNRFFEINKFQNEPQKNFLWLKFFYCLNSLAPPEMQEICKQNLFIMLSSWDTAVCLHFWAKFKMAARGPKRVPGQVFLMFPITEIFFSSLQFIKVKIEGVWKCLMIFLLHLWLLINKQLAWKKNLTLWNDRLIKTNA